MEMKQVLTVLVLLYYYFGTALLVGESKQVIQQVHLKTRSGPLRTIKGLSRTVKELSRPFKALLRPD